MNDIKGRPLIIAMGVTFGVLLVLTLVNQGVSAALGPDLSTIDFNDPESLQGNNLLTIISCLITLCVGIVYIGAGMLYANLHGREGVVETQTAAIGGAVAALVPAVLNSITSTIISFAINGELVSQVISQLPPEFADAGGALAGVGIIAALISLCCVLVIGGFLGALGGVIGASVFGRQ